MKAIHPDNCMLWIRYQSPDPRLGPRVFLLFLSLPPSPCSSSLAPTIQWGGQSANKQLRNQRAVMFPCAENLSRSLPLPFQRPGCPPSLQQPAGTLLLCYSWPACSCSYSPRLTQQQLLCVCQLASRSPKSSCPPRSPCFPASPPTDLRLLSHPRLRSPQAAAVSYHPPVLSLPPGRPYSPRLLSGKHPLLSLLSLLNSNRSSLKWSGKHCL